ncbi:hypothetical protein D3C74_296180 [compost metagenome]
MLRRLRSLLLRFGACTLHRTVLVDLERFADQILGLLFLVFLLPATAPGFRPVIPRQAHLPPQGQQLLYVRLKRFAFHFSQHRMLLIFGCRIEMR